MFTLLEQIIGLITSVRISVYALITELPIKLIVIIDLNVFIYVNNINTIRNLMKKYENVYAIGTNYRPCDLSSQICLRTFN